MGRQILFATPRFDVCLETSGDGDIPQRHFFLAKPDAVLIVPYSADCIVMLKVNRLLLDRASYELPGGRIDHGEDALTAARRELLEECSLTSDTWHHLVTTFPLPSLTTERVHIFSAKVQIDRECVVTECALAEGIESIRMCPFTEARKLALEGDMRCAVDAYALLVFLNTERASTKGLTHA